MCLALSGLQAPAAARDAPGEPDFAAIVVREAAAVVSIRISHAPRRAAGDDEGQARAPMPKAGAWTQVERDLASGFVVSADGYIMTAAHAVVDADDVVVQLPDGRQFAARVVGADAPTDVALLKIEASGLTAASIGNSEELTSGEWVLAMGAPFGLQNSVTAGIVSAPRRYLPGAGGVPLIQTDVAINAGSSGGPLLNRRGQVVGLNTMIFSSTGGYMGVSLAVPINLTMKLADELRSSGRIVRGQLGVKIQELTPDLARSFGAATTDGALVTRVVLGSAAERAGLRGGDIILGLGDRADTGFGELQQQVAAALPGARLALNVWRRGEVLQVTVIVARAPVEIAPPAAAAALPPEERLGLVLAEIGLARRHALRVDGGLAVREASGTAARAGIQANDVIAAVGDRPVTDLAAFDAAVAAVPPDRSVALLVVRAGAFGYVTVPQRR